MNPLSGYDCEERSYLVDDYPYGAKLRCRIRYWIERNGNKGYRFCSQTEHPTKKVWNAPKRSTYVKLAAAMYLDENQHVKWSGLSEYITVEEAQNFVKKFPDFCTTEFADWVYKKSVAVSKLATGEVVFTINGTPQRKSDAEKEELRVEALAWYDLAKELGGILMGKHAV